MLSPRRPSKTEEVGLRKISQFSLINETSDCDHREYERIASSGGLQQSKGKLQKLHLAVLSGNEEDAKRILNKGVDVNVKDSFGKTPLHNAVLGKQLGIVSLLLKSGAGVRNLDERGDTPLHSAVWVGDQDIVQEMLKHGKCDVNMQGFMASTPLHIAAQTDNVEICKKLVELGGSVTLSNANNMTPLGVAVAEGAASVVEYFFEVVKERQLNVDNHLLYNADSDGSTLLHLAVDSGILQVVDLCLQNGARVRKTKESSNSTAFHLACTQGSLEIVKRLHNEDGEIIELNMTDDHDMTPLHRAAASNRPQIASFLIEKGASVNARDMEGRSALFLAASVGGDETVQVLMDHNADVAMKDLGSRSVLTAAIRSTNTIEALTKSSAIKAHIVSKDASGYTPMHYATRGGHFETVALFMSKNKGAATVTSDEMFTPLHIAAKYGWPEIVKLLVKKRDVKMINCRTNKGKTPLHLACREGHEEIAEMLLMEGATIQRDHRQRTPLHMAAMCGSMPCAESILKTDPHCLNYFDKIKDMALNLAAMSGHAEMVSYLLSVPEQELFLNAHKQTVMDVAISAGKEDVAMAIIEHDRWKEVVESAVDGAVSQLQTLVELMPDVAERFLDKCMEKEGDPTSQNFKIMYDLKLIQGKVSLEDPDTFENSLAALKTMAERRRENCLTHPVCNVLMAIKWKRFGWITFMVNVLLYVAFLLPFTGLAVYQKKEENRLCGYEPALKDFHNSTRTTTCGTSDETVLTLHYIVIAFAVINVVKECIQIFRQRLKYVRDGINYIEWMIYLAALVYLWPVCTCKHKLQPEAAAFSLFLGWLNLLLYFRRFSFHGKYVIMLMTVFRTMLQVLLLLILFLIAFGTAFYVLLYNKGMSDTFYFTVLKTFVMTLGEVDDENSFGPQGSVLNSWAVNALFVVFCLVMPIILINTLIGLAVGDIESIQQKSMMERYVMQVELLLEIEESLPAFIMRRVQVDWHEEFPNRKVPLRKKISKKLIDFGQARSRKDAAKDSFPPAIAEIIERMEEQEGRLNEMHDMMKEQSRLLKLISRSEGKKTRENVFMNWIRKKKRFSSPE